MSKLTLHYVPGACSLSPHIALREAGLDFALDRLDVAGGKKTQGGGSYLEVNPKGSVPALIMADGEVLTEGAVIVQYIADQAPAAKLAPPAGTRDRYRLQEWLNFIATELHKGTSPLMSPHATDAMKAAVRERLTTRPLAYLEQHLGGREFLMDTFSVADPYLYYTLRTCKRYEVPLGPNLEAFFQRIARRPHVQAALAAEGLT